MGEEISTNKVVYLLSAYPKGIPLFIVRVMAVEAGLGSSIQFSSFLFIYSEFSHDSLRQKINNFHFAIYFFDKL